MIKRILTILISMGTLLTGSCSHGVIEEEDILAQTPPMGWNSWICFGTSVTEDEVKANADFMAEYLKPFGWEYVVIDAGWYAPGMVNIDQYEAAHPHQVIDRYGRLIVDQTKYPSAAESKGLSDLADYVHSLGLKLGLHIMRGMPIQAYEQDTPIKGSCHTAREIADTSSRCAWYHGFYGIDMDKPGAQEYYDSLFELYASWGIDYVKADDLLAPEYAKSEIDAISHAAANCGRDIVLSLSPGPAPIEQVEHMRNSAQLWRISEDFWDNWESLKKQFDLCKNWQPLVEEGHWPDADMLPIGPMAQRAMRGEPRQSNFTHDEQYTLMTLWAMFRSPMMLGCNLPEIDPFTYSLVTNEELFKILHSSKNNKEMFRDGELIVWYAESTLDESKYVALFNLSDKAADNYIFSLAQIEADASAELMEIWGQDGFSKEGNQLITSIPPHGVMLFKLN